MPSSSSNNNRRHRRRNYTSVANEDIDEEEGEFQDEPLASKDDSNTDDHNSEAEEEEDEETAEDLPMSLTILDSAQKKFPIPCDKTWTVGKFKFMSAKIHKVPPAQQRLIFRGKMLTKDDQTLEENKLDTDDLIVHLFPKPRVVVTANKNLDKPESVRPEGADEDGDTGIVDDSHGAHVPSIVIDQEEQERRGQILVLGSVEIAESQNNVKMLSLLLVMICAMRLLALFSIAMGAVDEENGEYYNGEGGPVHNHTGDVPHNNIYDSDFTDDTVIPDYEVREWKTQDYFDLLVSALGFYVGTLGMKATQENTFQLATAYAIGTVLAGIGWNLWNVWEFWNFYQEQQNKEYEHHEDSGDPNPYPDYNTGNTEDQPLTRDDYVTVAFFTILMPLFVWFLCCIRAFEFQRLIREAEEEAAERIRNEFVVREEEPRNEAASEEEAPIRGNPHEMV